MPSHMIFFKRRKPMRRGGKEPESRGEEGGSTTYEKRMDEITQCNIEHTDILEVLRGQIQEERLISWSKALNIDGFLKVHLPFDRLMALSKAEGLRSASSFVTAPYSYVRLIPQGLRALHLDLFSLPSYFDFLQ